VQAKNHIHFRAIYLLQFNCFVRNSIFLICTDPNWDIFRLLAL
jgi:hypothetical protein